MCITFQIQYSTVRNRILMIVHYDICNMKKDNHNTKCNTHNAAELNFWPI